MTGWASKCRDIVLISWDFTHVVCYVVRAGTCLYLDLQVGFVFSFVSNLVGSKAINVGTQAIYDAKIKTNELSTLLESCWIQSFPQKKCHLQVPYAPYKMIIGMLCVFFFKVPSLKLTHPLFNRVSQKDTSIQYSDHPSSGVNSLLVSRRVIFYSLHPRIFGVSLSICKAVTKKFHQGRVDLILTNSEVQSNNPTKTLDLMREFL